VSDFPTFQMPRLFHHLVAVTFAFSLAGVPVFGQETESLGDTARRIRSEKQVANEPMAGPAESSQGDPPKAEVTGPISKFQLFSWLAGGVDNGDLTRELQNQGLSFEPDEACFREITAASIPAIANEVQGAERHLSESAVDDADIVGAMVKAAIAVKGNDYRGAFDLIKPLIQSNANNPNFLLALGNIFNGMEAAGSAVQVGSHAVALAPEFPYTHGQLALAYSKVEDGERAMIEARKMLRLRPNSSSAHKFLGLGLFAEGNYDGALHEYGEALKLNPKNAFVYYDIGVLREDQKAWDSAIAAYQKAIELDPSHWFYYNNLGNTFGTVGRFDDGVNAFERGRTLAPDEPTLLESYGALL